MAEMGQINAAWIRVVEMAKQATLAPTLFRALDRAIPLAWENGQFVVGMDSHDGMLLSALQSGEYQLKIEQALRIVCADSAIKFRVVEGTTLDAWESAKIRDAAALKIAEQQAAKLATATVNLGNATSWDELYDQVSRLWQETEYRTMPTGKGRFLNGAFAIIEQGLETLGEPNEQTERLFARTIERLASLTATDATVLAYLLFERRRTKA